MRTGWIAATAAIVALGAMAQAQQLQPLAPVPDFDTVTVQVEFAPEPRAVGLQVSPLTTVAPAREMFAVCVLPFNVAVIVAV